MLALIPARGGSKGLPGKNIRLLNGKPLIAYTIEEALKSNHISRVVVSTDDKEIAKVAEQYGGEIPFIRPHNLATDSAKAIDVYKYTIDRLENDSQVSYDEFIVLQPTSPMRNVIHIDEAIELYKNKGADSVISYCEEEHPIFWHKYITEDGRFEDIFEGNYLKNRQDIKSTYYPNGAIYIFSKKIILKGDYYSDNSYAYIMDRPSSIDIDTIDDFEHSEYLMKK